MLACWLNHWEKKSKGNFNKNTTISTQENEFENVVCKISATLSLPQSVETSRIIIRTLHDCPSQMNENLLISNSKLTSDSELIWWR